MQTGVALRNTVIGMGVYRANLISRTEVHRVASFANEAVAENMKIDGTLKSGLQFKIIEQELHILLPQDKELL